MMIMKMKMMMIVPFWDHRCAMDVLPWLRWLRWRHFAEVQCRDYGHITITANAGAEIINTSQIKASPYQLTAISCAEKIREVYTLACRDYGRIWLFLLGVAVPNHRHVWKLPATHFSRSAFFILMVPRCGTEVDPCRFSGQQGTFWIGTNSSWMSCPKAKSSTSAEACHNICLEYQ